MKQIFSLLLVFCSFAAGAQTVPDFKSIKLEKTSDFRTAQPFVLQTANYVLSGPYDSKNKDQKESITFLASWMQGTPDFAFSIETMIPKIGKNDADAVAIFVAAACKAALEDKSKSADREALKISAIKILLAYAENPAHNFKLNKQLKKLAEANKKGELGKALE